MRNVRLFHRMGLVSTRVEVLFIAMYCSHKLCEGESDASFIGWWLHMDFAVSLRRNTVTSHPPNGSISPPFDPRAWQLWGKADPKRGGQGKPEWHPLLCHVLDVVASAEHLFRHVRHDRLEALAAALSLPPDGALPWLLFFVALHDLGKATPPFQAMVPTRRDVLVTMGLDFPVREEPHGNLSVPLATAVLKAWGVPAPLGRWVARAVGAHHGSFVSLEHLQRGLEEEKEGSRSSRHMRARFGSGPELLFGAHFVEALADACGIGPATPRVPCRR